MSEQPKWTKRCRECIEKERGILSYVPDDRELCDAHLLQKHGLWIEGHYDTNDTIGMGPRYYEEDAVLRVLTNFENVLKALRPCVAKMKSFSPIMWAEEIADAEAAIEKAEEKQK